MKNAEHKFGTLEYYKDRVIQLEKERDINKEEAIYYRQQLSKSHEILGRVIHQLSQRWDNVNLTEYYPTDNLHGKRTLGNPKGI